MECEEPRGDDTYTHNLTVQHDEESKLPHRTWTPDNSKSVVELMKCTESPGDDTYTHNLMEQHDEESKLPHRTWTPDNSESVVEPMECEEPRGDDTYTHNLTVQHDEGSKPPHRIWTPNNSESVVEPMECEEPRGDDTYTHNLTVQHDEESKPLHRIWTPNNSESVVELMKCTESPGDDTYTHNLMEQHDEESKLPHRTWTPDNSESVVEPMECEEPRGDDTYTHNLTVQHDEESKPLHRIWTPNNSESAHFGRDKTVDKVRERFYRSSLHEDVTAHISSDQRCQESNKATKRPGTSLHPIPVTGLWKQVGVVLIGPLKTTPRGNKYMATLVDYYSKWPEAAPLMDKSAASVAGFLRSVMMRMGCVYVLISDQGMESINRINTELFTRLSIEHRVASAYHPQTNGLVEKFNQTLQDGLNKLCNAAGDDWDTHIEAVLFGYRVSIDATTGFSPFLVMYGREPKLPIDFEGTENVSSPLSTDASNRDEFEARSNLRENMGSELLKNVEAAQARQKRNYDKLFRQEGVPNRGNTCFVSAGIQLLRVSGLIEEYERNGGDHSVPVLSSVCQVIRSLKREYSNTVRLECINTTLEGLPDLNDGRQHDSIEFIQEVLTSTCQTCNGRCSLLTRYCAMEVRSTLTCAYGHSWFGADHVYPVVLLPPLTGYEEFIGECLNNFFAVKSLDAVMCDSCEHRGSVELFPEPASKPRALFLQVPRWSPGHQQKDRTPLFIDEEISIDGSLYYVKAILCHVGEALTSGHYKTLIREDDATWTVADDSRVLQITKVEALSTSRTEVCGLLYTKSDEQDDLPERGELLTTETVDLEQVFPDVLERLNDIIAGKIESTMHTDFLKGKRDRKPYLFGMNVISHKLRMTLTQELIKVYEDIIRQVPTTRMAYMKEVLVKEAIVFMAMRAMGISEEEALKLM